MSVSDLRQSYEKNVLLEAEASASPLEQFSRWFDEAQAAKVPEPNAMTLATVDASGQPSARIVLIKGYDERGFTFSPTTNRARARTCWPSRAPACCSSGSRWNARCASRAWWKRSRPRNPTPITTAGLPARGSAPGPRARASPSPAKNWRPASREFRARYGDQPPRPPHWGGYRLKPTAFEFWQAARRACTTACATSPTAPAGRSNAYRRRRPRALRASGAQLRTGEPDPRCP